MLSWDHTGVHSILTTPFPHGEIESYSDKMTHPGIAGDKCQNRFQLVFMGSWGHNPGSGVMSQLSLATAAVIQRATDRYPLSLLRPEEFSSLLFSLSPCAGLSFPCTLQKGDLTSSHSQDSFCGLQLGLCANRRLLQKPSSLSSQEGI